MFGFQLSKWTRVLHMRLCENLFDEGPVEERVSKIASASGHVREVGVQIKTLFFHAAARVAFGIIIKDFIVCLLSLVLFQNAEIFTPKL